MANRKLSILKIAAISVLILFLAAAASYYYAIKHLPNLLANQAGYSVEHISGVSISTQNVLIKSLRLSPLKKTSCCSIQAEGLSLTRNNRTQLTIDVLNLSLPPENGSEESVPLITPISFPSLDIQLKKLALSPSTITPKLIEFSGAITSDPDQLKISGEISGVYNNVFQATALIKPNLQTDISLTSPQLTLGLFNLKNAEAAGSISFSKGIKTITPAVIKTGQISGPMDFQGSSFQIDVDPDRGEDSVLINNLKVDGYQGSLSSASIPISRYPDKFTFPVQLKKIDIETLLEMLDKPPIVATGALSGTLPITVQGSEVSVSSGKLSAEQPGGKIEYLGPDNALGESEQMKFALEMLKELDYQSLEADVSYKPDGTLTLATSIKGNNPKLNSSRPLNVNLNIEQNFLKLLESLRAIEEANKLAEQAVKSRGH